MNGRILEGEQVRELDENLVAQIAGVEGIPSLAVVADEQSAAGGEVISEQRVDADVVAVLVARVLRQHASPRLVRELVAPARNQEAAELVEAVIVQRLAGFSRAQVDAQVVADTRAAGQAENL